MDNKYEIIPKPATPPKEWKDIDPYLGTKGNPNLIYLFVLVPLLLFTLAFSAAFFGWFISIVTSGVMVLVLITMFGKQVDEYAIYAT